MHADDALLLASISRYGSPPALLARQGRPRSAAVHYGSVSSCHGITSLQAARCSAALRQQDWPIPVTCVRAQTLSAPSLSLSQLDCDVAVIGCEQSHLARGHLPLWRITDPRPCGRGWSAVHTAKPGQDAACAELLLLLLSLFVCAFHNMCCEGLLTVMCDPF